MNAPHPPPVTLDDTARRGGVGAPVAHDSAELHVSGEARYTDDLPEPRDTLHMALGVSPVAHGRLDGLDLTAVRSAPGVVDVIAAADVPGVNDVGPIQHDDPIFAAGVVEFAGQPVFAVAATDVAAARRAAKLARLDIAPLPAILTIDDAMAAQSFVLPPVHVTRGDAETALARAPHRISGKAAHGGQDHFYLEGHIAFATPREDGQIDIHCASTQHPTEVQHIVARAMAKPDAMIRVECRRMGGGFGGKESQPALFACSAAMAASRWGTR